MTVKNYSFQLSTKGYCDIVNINEKVLELLSKSGIDNGTAFVFASGSTCGITTIEYESGCVEDLQNYFERVAPINLEYKHNLKWGDGNGFSHVRAAITKANFFFPIIDGSPVLGTWQQIIFIDFDNNSRNRTVRVQIIGE